MKHLITGALLALMTLPAAAQHLGDDGLYKSPWMRDTFKDLSEDLAEANAEGKRVVLLVEQRGCSYCKKMHEEVYSDPEFSQYIEDNFFAVQINLHGDTEMTDLDGESLSEKDAARKWRVLFTPTAIFLPEDVDEGQSAIESAVAVMPGAFSKSTAMDMYVWVNEERYALDTEEDFQRYHARMIEERAGATGD